ncbi:T9SS type A sorting domain-containing protein [Urechidicola croceus]|uniref:Secretion system C-terminal sorting domain-containing protein n=1 Tax=Urechidicola croceus TaxID=1850246 RepID=A0A1D8P6F2_9FLAO|nr:T9SS type A sorting domain-containing protein [Urechidicola croceus]AOW20129.1 hypothetical protein LPB138_05285 [Urechidicola croceus]
MKSQSVTITSIDTNPIELDPSTGGTVTVNFQYTSLNVDDIVYVALELQDDWTWLETTADANINPVTMGTDLTGSVVLTIPSSATLTDDLSGAQNYKIKAELNDSSWSWIAGDYPATEIIIQASTAGLEDLNADIITMYPNPVSDKLIINNNLLDVDSLIITDVTGRTVKELVDLKGVQSLIVSDLPSGLYILITDTKKQFRFLKK